MSESWELLDGLAKLEVFSIQLDGVSYTIDNIKIRIDILTEKVLLEAKENCIHW